MVIIIIASWLLLIYRIPKESMLMAEVQNSGHALALFTLAFTFSLYFDKFFASSSRRTVILSFCVCVVFSGLVEIVQSKIGRSASWSDFLMDLVGISAGALAFLSLKIKGMSQFILPFVALTLLLGCFISPFRWLYAEKVRDSVFPIIGDFETPAVNRYFKGSYSASLTVVDAPEEWLGNESKVARIDVRPGSWPGIQAFEMQDDWRDYSTLKFQVYNPQAESLRVVLRVNDTNHDNKHDDRFNRTYDLAPGEHEISVEIDDIIHTRSGRVLNQKRLQNLMVYMNKPTATYTLYFDNFRLE